MISDNLKQQIATIPTGEEWWHPHNETAYTNLATELVETHGLTEEAAYAILSAAYWAAADEHGN
jgi:hypothetical protein